MKLTTMKNILLLILFFSSVLLVAQTPPTFNTQQDNLIYDSRGLETAPEFPGGIQKFHELFKAGLSNNYKGRLILMFIIEKDGSLTDVKVLRDVGEGSDEEALHILKTAPNWIPGRQNGRLVRVRYALHIDIGPAKTILPKKK